VSDPLFPVANGGVDVRGVMPTGGVFRAFAVFLVIAWEVLEGASSWVSIVFKETWRRRNGRRYY